MPGRDRHLSESGGTKPFQVQGIALLYRLFKALLVTKACLVMEYTWGA